MSKPFENKLDMVVTSSSKVHQGASQLICDANQGAVDVLLNELTMLTLQAAALHESLTELREIYIGDSEAEKAT